MDDILQFWSNQWHAYPQWLVITAVTSTVLLVFWLVAKFLAWLLKWLLIGAAVAVIVAGVVYLAG